MEAPRDDISFEVMVLCDGGCGKQLVSIFSSTPLQMRCRDCSLYRTFWADQFLDCLTLCKRYMKPFSYERHLPHCKINQDDSPFRIG